MDARDEVKSRLSIEDVIGRYLDLKKSGRNFKGLSPFSKEKTASFIVSPEKQIWHDFSSGKGGDVFTFVMEVEGLDFREALELLARRAGVDLESYDTKTRSSISKSRLYAVNELAAKFYQVQFGANKAALDYVLKQRKFTKQTAITWQLGYSPNTGDALSLFLKSKGYSDKEIQAAGLTSTRNSKTSDMFRGRLMIPLCDSQGRVIGFTARILDEDSLGPKYINTPQTVLYDKSRQIFGLHLAKEAIRQTGYVVIVEGNFDVIASHQAGVTQVVAVSGTALTEQHLKALSLLTKDIRLCFDADQAGVNATERAIPLASKQGVNISVISLPSGKDPDELLQTSKKDWEAAIEDSSYALDWLIKHYSSQIDLNSAPGKRRFSDLLLPVIRSLTDEVERDHYINQLAELLQVSPLALNQKLLSTTQTKISPKLPIKVAAETINKVELEIIKAQDNFLSLVLIKKKLRTYMQALAKEMFLNENGQELFLILNTHPDFDVKKDSSSLNNLTDYVKIEVLLFEELYSGLDDAELGYEAARLRTRLVENYVKNQKQEITKKLHSSDDSESRKLLEKVKKLDVLLNEIKKE